MRTYNTLFLLQSVDGKISTGAIDERDFDTDLPKVSEIGKGLFQYYDLEKQTDRASFNSGKVMAKIGVNERTFPEKRDPLTFVILDNKPHLTARGVEYLSRWVDKLIIVTSNKKHPAFSVKRLSNLETIGFVEFEDLFKSLKSKYGIERITIQSGGTLNAELLRSDLIDEISIVVAPALVGGKDTPTLVDGRSIKLESDLKLVKPLKLIEAKVLQESFLNLRYKVLIG